MAERIWYCKKCNVEMEKKNIPTTYIKMIGFEKGWICPQCKSKFLSEEAVTVSIMRKELRGAAKMD